MWNEKSDESDSNKMTFGSTTKNILIMNPLLLHSSRKPRFIFHLFGAALVGICRFSCLMIDSPRGKPLRVSIWISIQILLNDHRPNFRIRQLVRSCHSEATCLGVCCLMGDPVIVIKHKITITDPMFISISQLYAPNPWSQVHHPMEWSLEMGMRDDSLGLTCCHQPYEHMVCTRTR